MHFSVRSFLLRTFLFLEDFMKLLVAGSRSIKEFDLSPYIPDDVDEIISGGANGIDAIAEKYADDHRISVQYFPSREGGCEMFISNLQSDDREYSTCAKSMTALQKVPLQLQPAKRNGSFRRECAYRFEELPNLLLACQRLLQIGYLCESSAYRDEQTYFLILTVTSSSPFSLPDELDFLVEYGTIQNPATLLLYIREHATLIRAGDAIAVLGELA